MAPVQGIRKNITVDIAPAHPLPPTIADFKDAAARDASNWNHLLRWHRHNRGPQWDHATAMYHVDRGSAEYFGGVERASLDEEGDDEMREDSPDRSPSAIPQGKDTPPVQPSSRTTRSSGAAAPQFSPPPNGVPKLSASPGVSPSQLPPMPMAQSQASPSQNQQQRSDSAARVQQLSSSMRQQQQQQSPFTQNPGYSLPQQPGLPMNTPLPPMPMPAGSGYFPGGQPRHISPQAMYGSPSGPFQQQR